jgi:hypothetical protein
VGRGLGESSASPQLFGRCSDLGDVLAIREAQAAQLGGRYAEILSQQFDFERFSLTGLEIGNAWRSFVEHEGCTGVLSGVAGRRGAESPTPSAEELADTIYREEDQHEPSHTAPNGRERPWFPTLVLRLSALLDYRGSVRLSGIV